MTITVQCGDCGARFAAGDHLAGKRVRCPTCQGVIPVPAAAARQAEISLDEPALAASKVHNLGDLLDDEPGGGDSEGEYALAAAERDPNRCPICHAEMDEGTVLCLACGFHRKKGQQLETRSGRLAQRDEEKAAEDEGLSLTGTLTVAGIEVPIPALLGAGGFALFVAMVLYFVFPAGLFLLLLMGGAILTSAGHLWVIIAAFSEETRQGVLTWLVPFYWWVYALSRFDDIQVPFFVKMSGWGMILLAIGVGMTTFGN